VTTTTSNIFTVKLSFSEAPAKLPIPDSYLGKYAVTYALQNPKSGNLILSLRKRHKMVKQSHSVILEYSLTEKKVLRDFRLRKSKKIRKIALFKGKDKNIKMAILAGHQNLVYDLKSGQFLRFLKTAPEALQNLPNEHLKLFGDLRVVTDFRFKRRIVLNQGRLGFTLHDAYTGELLRRVDIPPWVLGRQRGIQNREIASYYDKPAGKLLFFYATRDGTLKVFS